MSDEQQQNDSPAFRLRPRRAAPKSYYEVRVEYSANPSAFIRERTTTNSKRKVFTSKTGSQRVSTIKNNSNNGQLQTIVSKEEKELEAKRMLLQREISESITDNRLISPFMQRLCLDELRPDSVYEHNYITLRIKRIGRSTNGHLAHCLCESTDDVDDDDNNNQDPPVNKYKTVSVRLYNEYAETPLLKPEKLISIAKFKTSPLMPWQESESDNMDESRSTPPTTFSCNDNDNKTTTNDNDNKSGSLNTNTTNPNEVNNNINNNTNNNDDKRLPFMVIVKYDEFNKNANKSTSSLGNFAASSSYRLDERVGGACDDGGDSSSATSSVTITLRRTARRPLIPFISITDMIEQPVEPFVEMGPSSPVHKSSSSGRYNDLNNHNFDETSQETKRIKITAAISPEMQQPQPQNQQQQQQCSSSTKINTNKGFLQNQ